MLCGSTERPFSAPVDRGANANVNATARRRHDTRPTTITIHIRVISIIIESAIDTVISLSAVLQPEPGQVHTRLIRRYLNSHGLLLQCLPPPPFSSCSTFTFTRHARTHQGVAMRRQPDAIWATKIVEISPVPKSRPLEMKRTSSEILDLKLSGTQSVPESNSNLHERRACFKGSNDTFF